MTNQPRRIAILGSTGSIGVQALQVIAEHKNHFITEVLVAHKNAPLLIEQAKTHHPNAVVIADELLYPQVKEALREEPVKIYAGYQSVCDIVEMDTIDMILTAMVGFAGLEPTIRAIRSKKNIALSNKETLVVAGELIMNLARKNGVNIIPVDSEHSAIFQCLRGETPAKVEKIILTASGGPFLNQDQSFLQKVTKHEALKHPNWNMGNKVTIDSATLMNKGLEMIEARWLFGLDPAQIEVIIHPQSIIHSMIQFIDSSIKAQMGLPDMRLPIQYALSFPERLPSSLPRFDFLNFPELTFQQPDTSRFRNLELAFRAMHTCGNMPCIMNAANEIAVDAFLNDRILFTDIPVIIENTMDSAIFIAKPDYESYARTDAEARKIARSFIK